MAKSKIDWLPILESEDDVGNIINYTHENRHSQKWKSDDSTAKMDTAKVNIP